EIDPAGEGKGLRGARLESLRKDLRKQLRDLGVPGDIVTDLLKDRKWTAVEVLDAQGTLTARAKASWGAELGDSFAAGQHIHYLFRDLERESNSKGSIGEDLFRTQMDLATQAVADARFPKEARDVLSTVGTMIASGLSEQGRDYLQQFLDRLSNRETGLKFF